MGLSRIHFLEKSFEVQDVVMEVILKLIIDEIDQLEVTPDWLKELRDDWYIVATEEFGFGSIPNLEPLNDFSRREMILKLAQNAIKRLRSFGDPISINILNGLGAGNPSSQFKKDLPAKIFLDSFHDFIQLLK